MKLCLDNGEDSVAGYAVNDTNRLRLSNVFFVVVVFFFQQQVYTSKNIEHKTMDFSYPLPEVSWLARLVQWNIHILFGNKEPSILLLAVATDGPRACS